MLTLDLDAGAPAYCKEGRCGTLRMVVTSPKKGRITDLVIELDASARARSEERSRSETGGRYVVPVALAERVNEQGVHLSISRQELKTYPEA